MPELNIVSKNCTKLNIIELKSKSYQLFTIDDILTPQIQNYGTHFASRHQTDVLLSR